MTSADIVKALRQLGVDSSSSAAQAVVAYDPDEETRFVVFQDPDEPSDWWVLQEYGDGMINSKIVTSASEVVKFARSAFTEGGGQDFEGLSARASRKKQATPSVDAERRSKTKKK